MRPDLQRQIGAAVVETCARPVLAPRLVEGVLPPERLAIHARNVRASLTDALASVFPAVKRATGDGFFAYAAAQFIAAAPPRSPVVAAYGDAFPAFLAAFPACASLGWLGDLARLEWALHSLSDLLPTPPCRPAQDADPSRLRAVWSPTALIFRSPYPADLLLDGAAPGEIEMNDEIRLLIAVRTDAVTMRRIGRDDDAFLAALHDGASLADAIERALAVNSGFDPSRPFAMAVAEGCFTGLMT